VLELLIVLTLVEVAIFLGVLMLYLVLVLRRLRMAANSFSKISFGVRAIETQTGQVGPAVRRINEALGQVAAALPGVAERAERMARR
jgi:hypothetical protein